MKYEPLAKIVINSERFYDLFNYVEVPTFDIASDAFTTFKVSITFHMFVRSLFILITFLSRTFLRWKFS